MTSTTSLWTIFLSFLKLGCTSFGGPIAHIGFFRHEFVNQRQWISERDYADLVALCQFLPGPASSQVGMALGMFQRGYLGALVAWLGFTLPSALLMIGLALGLVQFQTLIPAGLLHGLKLVALAIVAQAVYAMAKTFCDDWRKMLITLLSIALLTLANASYWQVLSITIGALLGLLWLKLKPLPLATPPQQAPHPIAEGYRAHVAGWTFLLVTGLVALPLLLPLWPSPVLATIDAFFRAGSLVFGGGHAVLPLLQAEFVDSGAVAADTFIAGYGAVQAMPGPLFTFAGFLGAAIPVDYFNPASGIGMTGGLLGGCVALIAVFAPAFLLLAMILPFWQQLRQNAKVQQALAGIGASVVGILAHTLYQPIATSTLLTPSDVVIAVTAIIALQYAKISPWLLVLIGAFVGALQAQFL